MPGFDGTGPAGQGPLTGGGRGFCVVPVGNTGAGGYPVNFGYPYNTSYSRYNAPLYNNYPVRGAYAAPAAAGFGYFGRRCEAGILSGRFGRSRGRGARGMGRRI